MSLLRRSLLLVRVQTNNFSSSKRRIFSLTPSEFSKGLRHEFSLKLDPKMAASPFDKRPISLRFRVSSLIELSQFYMAAHVSRLAVLEKYHSLDSENMMRNEAIGALCAAKRYTDAISLYNFFRRESTLEPSAVSFNHIIKAHCDENLLDEALRLCKSLYNSPLVDVHTLRLLTKALVATGRIFYALTFLKSRGELRDSVAYSYLIRTFLDQGNHDKAYEIVDELNHNTMPTRSALVDATFVDYWLKQGHDDKAMEIYSSLITRKGEGEEVVCAATGNTLLEILFDNGKPTEAWDLFNAMITNSNTFNTDTFSTMVNACFKLGHFDKARVDEVLSVLRQHHSTVLRAWHDV